MGFRILLALTVLQALVSFSFAQDSAQLHLDEKIDLEPGTYGLKSLLKELRDAGVPLAFSSDKLVTRDVAIDQILSAGELLELLQTQKVIRYQITGAQIFITQYESRKFTLNGVLKDADTGEYLIGASISVGESQGTITNGYGYYSITLGEGQYPINISHVGYENYETEIDLERNIYLSLALNSTTVSLEQVEIHSMPDDINISSSVPSISRIPIDDQLRQIPYLLGEVDIIRNALLRPGISSIGEDASGVHVRGGRVDQNLVLLDEAIIYNPSHYILASIFTPEAMNNVSIYKGFIPPSYGGRTSSVIEIRQKEGNTNEMSYSGGIGPFAVRGLIEGPFRKGKSSFLASARQSLLNVALNDFNSSSVRRNRNSFRDINLKINSRPNPYNTYYLSGYIGNDRNAVGLNSIRRWGNSSGTFRWNHIFTPRLFSNLSAFISEYSYQVSSEEEPGAFVATSRIVDYSLKSDLTYSPNPNNELNFGFDVIFHRLKPGERTPFNEDATTNTIRLDTEHGLESAIYVGHQTSIGKVKFNYGARYSALRSFGPQDVRIYQPGAPIADSTVIDTVSYGAGELIKRHANFEPRVAINWTLSSNLAIKAAYSKTAQYLHLLSNTLTPAPTDIWKLSDTYIPPTVSDQYTLGFYKNSRNNQWESSVEVYYKDNQDEITYKQGADLVFNENIETELLVAHGRAYGLELYLEKKYGNLTGWISYTLSRTETEVVENGRRAFVLNNFDKTHNFSTTWVQKFNNRMSVSGNFVYSTGIPLTLPSDKYLYEGNLVPLFLEQNTSRLPDYHRLDLSFKMDGKATKRDGSPRKNRDSWVFTLYNVYARKNANTYFFRQSNNAGLGEIVQYSVFGTIIPSISYNFKF